MSKQSNITYDYTIIKPDRLGKPRVDKDTYFFNISHSDDYVACVVANREVGIDIEQTIRVKPSAFGRFMDKSELDGDTEPLYIWVVKEAYYKYSGVQSSLSDITAQTLIKKYHPLILHTSRYYCAIFADQGCGDAKRIL